MFVLLDTLFRQEPASNVMPIAIVVDVHPPVHQHVWVVSKGNISMHRDVWPVQQGARRAVQVQIVWVVLQGTQNRYNRSLQEEIVYNVVLLVWGACEHPQRVWVVLVGSHWLDGSVFLGLTTGSISPWTPISQPSTATIYPSWTLLPNHKTPIKSMSPRLLEFPLDQSLCLAMYQHSLKATVTKHKLNTTIWHQLYLVEHLSLACLSLVQQSNQMGDR